MAKRKAIPLRIRTEVFKRDGFTCQYCGRTPPEVVLEIDHVKPVSKGGTNDITNLVTACRECNLGKSNIELDDNTIIARQRKQLQDLNEKHEQLKMMIEWKEGLSNIAEKEVNAINDLLERETGYGFNDTGKKTIKNLIKKYGLNEVYDCTEIAINQYYNKEDDWESMFKKIAVIAKYRKNDNKDPVLFMKNKLCKYASKKFADRYDRHEMMKLLDDCHLMPNEEEIMFDLLKDANTWDELVDDLVEQADIVADIEEAHRWLEKNGNKTSG